MSIRNTAEYERLQKSYDEKTPEDWLEWGPYLSERQWGTVREDYSQGGNAWDYFSHDQSRSRAYRWGEDGLAGLSDAEQKLCFALALWNGRDPILKERLFGLTNSEGNHGEDVKEYYFYVDNTPTHSYMKWLYKYPQLPFPYQDLVEENGRRKATDPKALEYELMDTGVFDENRYFDVQVEYAKKSPKDISIKIQVTNHGPDAASVKVLPTLWFRNTWSWFLDKTPPQLQGEKGNGAQSFSTIEATTCSEGATSPMKLYCDQANDLLFVDNETNNQRLWGSPNRTPCPKDGISDYLLAHKNTVNPDLKGTKGCAVYTLNLAPQETQEIHLRLSADLTMTDPFGAEFQQLFQTRLNEADAFYGALAPAQLTDEQKMIQRQAYAGMLWSKQYYHYVVSDWLNGDPAGPPPPPGRSRNAEWKHVYMSNIFSMPDAWEYPWFAAWDLCFHTVVFARIDPTFAKNQLLTLAREWYMAPEGAIPAYEWEFSDINPPLHAWAALRIFKIEKEMLGGEGDVDFLSELFSLCLMNFTWWSTQEDVERNNLFEGGFLGLDNISIINRSNLADFENQIGHKVILNQSDGTSWMGMFCLNMMEMALILTESGRKGYRHLTTKFFQHFVFIADALNGLARGDHDKVNMWDEEDGFYYDFLKVFADTEETYPIQLRSLVGVVALFPVITIDLKEIEESMSKAFVERMEWFLKNHPELLHVTRRSQDQQDDLYLLSFVSPERLVRILDRVLDETEFLSPHGIRGISKVYEENPYILQVENSVLSERYVPAESWDGAFGGNSNWRGPVWFPINFLFIETLERFHEYLGDDFKVEYPAKTGNKHTLKEIADDLSRRMIRIFERDEQGNRPVFGGMENFQKNPSWQNLILYYEYFHGDNGAGVGASHQTGWTGLVAELLNRNA